MARTKRDAKIVLFAGPGNNGGDALACAAELAQAGYVPVVNVLADITKYAPDATQSWNRVQELCLASSPLSGECDSGARIHLDSPSKDPPLPNPPPARGRGQIVVRRETPVSIEADWIVDGLFGIGLKRPLDAGYSDAVSAIAGARAAGAKVLALDVPSGIDANTGALVGNSVVATDYTLTFLVLKPGLLTGPALDYVGELHCDTLGVESSDNSAVHAIDHTYIDTIRHQSPPQR